MVSVRTRGAPVSYAEKQHKDLDDSDEERSDEEQLERGSEDERQSDEEEEDVPEEPIPQPRKVGRPRKQRPENLPELAGDAALLAAVRGSHSAIAAAAREWVARYHEDRAAGTAELMTFLLQGCGVGRRAVGADEAEHSSADDINADVDKLAREDGLDELLGPKSARHLKLTYREVWDKVVREAGAAGILTDGFLVDKVINLVIALNTSAVREFRRASTAVAAQLAASFLHVVAGQSEVRDAALRQAAAEEGRTKGRGAAAATAAERSAAFRRQVESASASISELLAYVDCLFQSVFTNRFRDIDPEVRLTVVEGIGRWMLLFPATFLAATYLKYVAWALSDRDPNVRLAATSALLALFSQPGNASQLHDFTNRFAVRLQELMSDVNDHVAVAGVRLVALLVRLGQLPAAAAGQAYRLMSDASAPLRTAAAELAVGMLKERGEEAVAAAGARAAAPRQANASGSTLLTQLQKNHPGAALRRGTAGEAGLSGTGKPRSYSEEEHELAGVLHVLRLLATEEARLGGGGGEAGMAAEGFMEDSLPAGHAPPLGLKIVSLVVGALFDRTPVLHNWHLMCEWLRDDSAANIFGDGGSTDLARCLLAALCHVTGSATSAGGSASAARSTQKQKAAREAARQEATLALMHELPELLSRCQTDPDQVAAVATLVPNLKLELYALRRQEKVLVSLLSKIQEVFFMHADAAAAAACVDAIAACSQSTAGSIGDSARLILGQVVTKVGGELESAVAGLEAAGESALAAATAAFHSSNGQEESVELFMCHSALTRVEALLQANVSGEEPACALIRTSLKRLLDLTAAGTELPVPIVGGAGRAALLLVMHDLSRLDAAAPAGSALADLAAAVDGLGGQVEAIAGVAGGRGDQEVALAISLVQSDLASVFSHQGLPEPLQAVAYRPSDSALEAFWLCMEVPTATENGADAPDTPPSGPAVRVEPLKHVARLAACAAVPQYRTLAAHVVSHWESGAGAAGPVARELVRQLKTFDAEALPSVYLEAMKEGYRRCKQAEAEGADRPGGSGRDEEEDEDEEAWLAPFLVLCERIASSQAAFNSPAATLAYLTIEGARWAVEGGPERMDFLQGASYFMARLKGAAALSALEEVQAAGGAAGAPERDQDEEGGWELYHDYCDVLAERGAKAVHSALRKGGGGRGRAGRKISFAPGAGSDGEEQDQEEAEEEAAAAAAAGRAPAEAAVAPSRRGRGRGRGRGKGAGRGSRASRGRGARVNTDSAAEEDFGAALDRGNSDQEEEEEEEDLGDGVLPTEEQLPVLAGRGGGRTRTAAAPPAAAQAKGPGQQRQRAALHPLLDSQDQMLEDDDVMVDEDDEVLIDVPYDAAQPVRSRAAAAAAAIQQQGESEDEEPVQHARRRRRR